MATPLCVDRAAGGRGKYGKQNRNQIQWAGPVSICGTGPVYIFQNKRGNYWQELKVKVVIESDK